jgi:hypothetical protein
MPQLLTLWCMSNIKVDKGQHTSHAHAAYLMLYVLYVEDLALYVNYLALHMLLTLCCMSKILKK